MTDPNPPQPVDTAELVADLRREYWITGDERLQRAADELDELLRQVATMRTALEPIGAAVERATDAVGEYFGEYGAEHADAECPEDDTCRCPLLVELNAAVGALSRASDRAGQALRAAPVEQPPRSFDGMVAQLSRWLENYPDGSIVSNPTGDPGARFTWAIRQALHELRAPVEPAPKGPGDGG